MEPVTEEADSPKNPKLTSDSMEWLVCNSNELICEIFRESKKWIFKIAPAEKRGAVARPVGPIWIVIDASACVSWHWRRLIWPRTRTLWRITWEVTSVNSVWHCITTRAPISPIPRSVKFNVLLLRNRCLKGKKHQANLARRAAKEAKEQGGPSIAPARPNVPLKKFIKIGRPGYKVTKQRDAGSGQQSLLFQVMGIMHLNKNE